jgi:hypothetical protein
MQLISLSSITAAEDPSQISNCNSTEFLNKLYYVRFEVSTAVTMKKAVFWDVAPCRNCVNRRFGETYGIHLQGRRQEEIRSIPPNTYSIPALAYYLLAIPPDPSPPLLLSYSCVYSTGFSLLHLLCWFARGFLLVFYPEDGGDTFLYLSVALQSFVGPWQLVQFLNPVHSR